MQRQRGGLIPIGDALSGMGGPMKSIREASPQALHHFTLSDQVNSDGWYGRKVPFGATPLQYE